MDVSCLLPHAQRTASGLLGARPIKRVRRLFLVLALATALVQIGVLLAPSHDASALGRIAPVAGLVALWVLWRRSCHHQHLPRWSDPAELALLTAIGLTAGAHATFGLLLVGVLFRSLFTGPARTALGVAGYEAVHLLAIAVGPHPGGVELLEGLQALPVFAIGAATMHGFARSLIRYDALQEELAAAAADRHLAALVRHSSEIITVLDAEGRVTYQSPSIARLGYREGELVGTVLADLVHPDDRDRVRRGAAAMLSGDRTPQTIECRWRTRAGAYRVVQTLGNDLLDDPDVRGVVLTTRDVTEHRALEEELRHRAFHDGLTGLANRASSTSASPPSSRRPASGSPPPRSCCSTSTTSRRSTTRSATPPATTCS